MEVVAASAISMLNYSAMATCAATCTKVNSFMQTPLFGGCNTLRDPELFPEMSDYFANRGGCVVCGCRRNGQRAEEECPQCELEQVCPQCLVKQPSGTYCVLCCVTNEGGASSYQPSGEPLQMRAYNFSTRLRDFLSMTDASLAQIVDHGGPNPPHPMNLTGSPSATGQKLEAYYDNLATFSVAEIEHQFLRQEFFGIFGRFPPS
jgi:hypothetical protein